MGAEAGIRCTTCANPLIIAHSAEVMDLLISTPRPSISSRGRLRYRDAHCSGESEHAIERNKVGVLEFEKIAWQGYKRPPASMARDTGSVAIAWTASSSGKSH